MNKLADEYNNSYHRSIVENPIGANYSAFTEKIESIHKVPKFKIGDRVRMLCTKYKNILRSYTKIWFCAKN